MLHTKFEGHQPIGFREEDFLRFYHIWAWRPSWSCDQVHFNILSFPHPTEAPYEIWLWLAEWFLRRWCLKSVDDGRRWQRNERMPTYPISLLVSLWIRWAKKISLKSDFIHIFAWFYNWDRQPIGVKIFISTLTFCHTGHLLSIKWFSNIFPEEIYIFPHKNIRKQRTRVDKRLFWLLLFWKFEVSYFVVLIFT